MIRSDHFVGFNGMKISRMFLLNLILALSTLVAIALFWWATALHGIGIHSDAVPYLWVAESLSKGLGFGVLNAFGQFTPVSDWPPLYPLLLSIFLWLARLVNPQVSVGQIAGLIGLLLTGGSTWMFGKVIAKVSNRSILFVLFGIVFLISSPIFWDNYLYATPEPLFVFLSLLTLYFFLDYLRTYSNSTLFWAGLFAGLGLVTRYVGIHLILVMGVTIFFASNRSRKRNFFAFSHITALGLFPLLLWGLRNYSLSGITSSQRLAFVPLSVADWGNFWAGLLNWLSPMIEIFKFIPLGLGGLLAFGVLLGSLVFYYRKRVYGNNESQEKWWKILLLNVFSYTFFLLISKLFFDPSIHLEEARMFFPIYLGILCLIISLLSNAEEIKFLVLPKYVFYAAFGIMVIFTLVYANINSQITYSSLASSRENGLELNSAAFKNMAVWPKLRELQQGAKVPVYYSDNVEALYWANQTPSELLVDIDPDLSKLFQPVLPEHDIIIVVIENSNAGADVVKYYPAAQEIYSGADGAIFILRSTPVN